MALPLRDKRTYVRCPPCPSIPRGASRPRSISGRTRLLGRNQHGHKLPGGLPAQERPGGAAPDARGHGPPIKGPAKLGTFKKRKRNCSVLCAARGHVLLQAGIFTSLLVSFSGILRVRLHNRPSSEARLTPDSLPLLTARARRALRRGRRAVTAEQLGASSSERAGPRRGQAPASWLGVSLTRPGSGRRGAGGRSRAARKGPGCNPPARRGRGRCRRGRRREPPPPWAAPPGTRRRPGPGARPPRGQLPGRR